MPKFPAATPSDQRNHPRLKLPAMYTLLRARMLGKDRYDLTGHIYDISISGMRFELDDCIKPDSLVEIRCMLPGKDHTTFRATGRVVRLHSDEENLGPAIMGMSFVSFRSPMDHQRLAEYLEARGIKPGQAITARAA